MNNQRELHSIAEQASTLEREGRFEEADKLRMILESHNCCMVCGTKVMWDESFYKRTGLWKCPFCDS